MANSRYIRVKSRFWTDEKARNWDNHTKLLALYLLTSPHNNMLGCYVLPQLYICADLEWSTEQLAKPFSQLLADGFIEYDESSCLIWVKNFLKHNPLENPNQVQAAIKIATELPSSPILSGLQGLLKRFNKPFLEPLVEQFGKPVTVTVTVTGSVDQDLVHAPKRTNESETSPVSSQKDSENSPQEGAQSKTTGKGTAPAENSPQEGAQSKTTGKGTAPAENSSQEGAQSKTTGKGTAPAENSSQEGAQSKTTGTKAKGAEYTQEFEEFWHAYPRRQGKLAAFRCWKTRKKEGYKPRDMIRAAVAYGDICRKNGTEERFIKLGKTFLGPSKWFTEYLEIEQTEEDEHAKYARERYTG